MSGAADNWKRLGDQLVARRVELKSDWSNRRRFTEDAGVDYRVVYDIERAKRNNFSTPMIRRLEKAYRLRAGAIPAVLRGDDMRSWIEGSEHGPPGRVDRNDDGTLDEKGVEVEVREFENEDGWARVFFTVPPGLTEADKEMIVRWAQDMARQLSERREGDPAG